MTDRPLSEPPIEPTAPPAERPAPRPGASVRVRLSLLVALVLLPATLLLAYVGYESGRNARRAAEDELLRLAELVAASQAQRLTEARDVLAVMAQFPEVRAGDGAACTERLVQILQLLPAYTGLGVADTRGRLFCATTPLTQPSSVSLRAWFTPTLTTNGFVVGDYFISRQGAPVLGLAYPVRDDAGNVAGVVSAGLSLHALNEAAATIPLPDDTDLLLFDRDGTVLAHAPEAERWLGQDHPELPLVRQALSATTTPAVTQQTGLDGVARVYATLSLHSLGGSPLYLALGRPVEAVYAAAGDLQRRNLAGIILLEALAILTIWQASVRLLLRPMQELERATRRLTRGDLSARTGLDHREGEFGQLAYAFDHLAETLSRREAARAALAQENAQLYAQAQQLNADLEARVAGRTAQLAAANRELETEVAERLRMEAELARSHAQLREVHAHMQAAREDERTRISREIHDELGGMLTGLKMDVARLHKALPAPAAERLNALSSMIDETVRTVRRIATDLRPALLDDFGLAAAIEWQLQEFAKRSGLDCRFVSQLGDLEWDPDASTGVFRAFQETLTNVARHAQAQQVRVTLAPVGELIELRIADDGRGITAGELAGLKSLGLAGMRERIEALHGRVRIEGAPGAGTTVVIQVPLQALRRRPGAAEGTP